MVGFWREVCGLLVRWVCVGVVCWLGVVVWCVPAGAAACPDEATREVQPHGLLLPDCRDYEQVPPAGEGKNGNDANDFPGVVGASPSGDRVHYFSSAPFLGAELINGENVVAYLSSRGVSGGWVTQGMAPVGAEHGGVLGFDDDLSQALVEAAGGEAFSEEASPNHSNYYLHSAAGAYQWLVSTSGFGSPIATEFSLAGFSGDGERVIFESTDALAAGAAEGEDVANLYELDLEKPAGQQLSLVGVVPSSGESCSGAGCVTPAQGSYAGAGGEIAFLKGSPDGFGAYTQSAISESGGLVFFTALPSGELYMRVGEASTLAVSAGPARFLGATPDGEYVFYSEGGRLYRGFFGEEQGEALALYRYDTVTHEREAITKEGDATGGTTNGEGEIKHANAYIVDVKPENPGEEFVAGQSIEGEGIPPGDWIRAVEPERIVLWKQVNAASAEHVHLRASSPAGVLGVLGFAGDGSSVYFAAIGVLASNLNAFGERAENRAGGLEEFAGNLYEWHKGAASVTFVAPLADFENFVDGGVEEDWTESSVELSRRKAARVSVDGSTLLFARNQQLFRYHTGAGGGVGSLVCVSCEPDGAPTSGEAQLDGDSAGGAVPRNQRILTRNLSENGDRVFFQSEAPLLPAAANGQMNVYEWETDGEGSCRSESQDDGCLYLISSGGSPGPSLFGDASANGDDVFFFTREQLAASDEDNNVDVYDARVCEAGDASCEGKPKQKEVACVGEACPGASPPGPPLAPSASSLLTGEGNLKASPPPPPSKPLTNKQKLALALKACAKDRNKKKRAACDALAHRRYGAKRAAKKTARGRS
jgi:hypothetical protein